MTRIVPLTEDRLDPAAAAVFQEIQDAFGRVPNLFRTYAHHPPLLRANWDKVKAVMMQGNLRRKVKETIAVLVSKDNSCGYCVAAHTAALQSLGMTADQIAALEQSLDAAQVNSLQHEAGDAEHVPHVHPARRDAGGQPNRSVREETPDLSAGLQVQAAKLMIDGRAEEDARAYRHDLPNVVESHAVA